MKDGERYSFYALDHVQQRVLARIHFLLVTDERGARRAVSLPQSPFGSVEYGAKIDEATLLAFVAFVVEELQRLPVSIIEIRDCIAAYREEGCVLLEPVLRKAGFERTKVMVNHHIEVNDQPLEGKMHRMERKRLRKCQREGFVFREEPLSSIDSCYQFLAECRSEKGWKLSMKLDEIKRAIKELPNAYKIFALFGERQRVAACLGVMVNDRIFYDFYHDSPQAYSAYSPIVMLLTHMYDHLQADAVRVLDMGTSLTSSLQSFKSHVGGRYAHKNTYVLLPATLDT